jgi:hypothetical protein
MSGLWELLQCLIIVELFVMLYNTGNSNVSSVCCKWKANTIFTHIIYVTFETSYCKKLNAIFLSYPSPSGCKPLVKQIFLYLINPLVPDINVWHSVSRPDKRELHKSSFDWPSAVGKFDVLNLTLTRCNIRHQMVNGISAPSHTSSQQCNWWLGQKWVICNQWHSYTFCCWHVCCRCDWCKDVPNNGWNYWVLIIFIEQVIKAVCNPATCRIVLVLLQKCFLFIL